jgi:hypothetical protein
LRMSRGGRGLRWCSCGFCVCFGFGFPSPERWRGLCFTPKRGASQWGISLCGASVGGVRLGCSCFRFIMGREGVFCLRKLLCLCVLRGVSLKGSGRAVCGCLRVDTAGGSAGYRKVPSRLAMGCFWVGTPHAEGLSGAVVFRNGIN